MRPKGQTFYTFVETEVFTRQLKALASIETLHAIESDLIANPERWPVIPGTKGARKGVLPIPNVHAEKRQFPLLVLVPGTPRTHLPTAECL